MPKKKEVPTVPVEEAVGTQLGDSLEQELGESPAASEEPPVKKKRTPAKKKAAKPKEPEAEAPPPPPAGDSPGEIPEEGTPLYIDRPTDNKEETLWAMLDWRAIRIGAKNGRVCTGSFTGLERISDTSEVAVADYKGCRVLIPLEEMISQRELRSLDGDFFKLRRRITQMMGAEVEFALMGVDEEAHTIVGSRRKAMENILGLGYEDLYQPDRCGRLSFPGCFRLSGSTKRKIPCAGGNLHRGFHSLSAL